MGNLICISGSRKSEKKEVDLNRQISPIPSLRHLKPKPAKQDTLQDICVGVVADNIWSLNAQVLPPELIQRVVDVLCDSGTWQFGMESCTGESHLGHVLCTSCFDSVLAGGL
jgi:hypothetical protein